MELEGVHYDAFLSYRHAEYDSFITENLHKRLEKFKLPASVKSKTGKRKIERVFRDVEELPLSDNLSDPINNALANSDYLICICTPSYLTSKWCMREIETFLQTHDREHVLLVLAQDEPVNSFPEILTYVEEKVIDADGDEVVIKKEMEPLAADVRGENKKENLKAMDTAVLKLCAAMFGLNYDDLKQRHHREKIKRLTTIWGSISATFLCVAVFAVVMLCMINLQSQVIETQYEELSQKYAGAMATSAEQLLGAGLRKDAVYAVRSVLAKDDEKYNSDAYYMLSQAMDIYSDGAGYIPYEIYKMPSNIFDFKVRKNGDLEVMDVDGNVHRFDTLTGDVISQRMILEDEVDLGFELNFDIEKLVDPYEYQLIDMSCDNGEAALLFYNTFDFTNHILIVDEWTGEIIVSFVANEADDAHIEYEDGILYLTQSSFLMYDSAKTTCYAIDTVSGETLWLRDLDNMIVTDVKFCAGNVFYTTYNSIIVLEKERGGAMNYFISENIILNSYVDEEDEFYFVDQKGGIFYVDEDVIMDVSTSKYAIPPIGFVLQAEYANGSLYLLLPNSDYVTRYCLNTSVNAEVIGSADEYKIYMPENTAMDFADRICDADENLSINSIYQAFYSDDEQIVVIIRNNGNILFYDSESEKLIQSLHGIGTEFIALKSCGEKYALNSYSY